MSRADYVGILVVALAGFCGRRTVKVLTLVDFQEWIEFVVAAFTFAVILFGNYEFIWSSSSRRVAGSGRVRVSQRSQGYLGPIP